MKKTLLFAVFTALALSTGVALADDELCFDGICYLTKEAADAARAAKAAKEAANPSPAAVWTADAGEAGLDDDGGDDDDDLDDDDLDDEGDEDSLEEEGFIEGEQPMPCEGGKCSDPDPAEAVPEASAAPQPALKARMRMGACSEEEFIGFLKGEGSGAEGGASDGVTAGKGFWALLLIAFLCGLMDNLTPCVLPLVPVNIAIIGRSAARGAVYGFGQITGAGVMGLVAALVGVRMGSLQSSVAFNVVAATAMAILGLAMLDVVTIDFTKFKKRFGKKGAAKRPKAAGAKSKKGIIGVWAIGAASVLLAGACVEPVLLAILLKTAEGVGAGSLWYAALPFAFGLGLALPWPFIGAGLGVLPKPGVWMVWLKRLLSLVVFGFAARYAYLAWRVSGAAPAAASVAVEQVGEGEAAGELVILSAPWCMNCYDMERTVLRQPDVLEAMRPFKVRHITINVFEDLAAYPELSGLDIQGLPCYVILER